MSSAAVVMTTSGVKYFDRCARADGIDLDQTAPVWTDPAGVYWVQPAHLSVFRLYLP